MSIKSRYFQLEHPIELSSKGINWETLPFGRACKIFKCKDFQSKRQIELPKDLIKESNVPFGRACKIFTSRDFQPEPQIELASDPFERAFKISQSREFQPEHAKSSNTEISSQSIKLGLVGLESSSTGSSFTADYPKPVPLA